MPTAISAHPAPPALIEHPAVSSESLIQSVLGDADRLKGDRPVALILQLASGLPNFAEGRAALLRTVLATLVRSALTCTERGMVAIAGRPVAGPEGSSAVRFTVTDTGIGGATGYALDTCRPMVAQLGGTLCVESAPGIGSCYTLEIVGS